MAEQSLDLQDLHISVGDMAQIALAMEQSVCHMVSKGTFDTHIITSVTELFNNVNPSFRSFDPAHLNTCKSII